MVIFTIVMCRLWSERRQIKDVKKVQQLNKAAYMIDGVTCGKCSNPVELLLVINNFFLIKS